MLEDGRGLQDRGASADVIDGDESGSVVARLMMDVFRRVDRR